MLKIEIISRNRLSIIQSIAHRTWPDTFGKILSPEQIRYMLEMMYDLAVLESQWDKGHTFLLAEENGSELGFAGFETSYAGSTKTKLHKIYLLPESQGKGVGKALILDIAERALKTKQTSLLLNVNKYNQKAIEFYGHIGFVEIYTEVIDIGNGYVMDDVVMELGL